MAMRQVLLVVLLLRIALKAWPHGLMRLGEKLSSRNRDHWGLGYICGVAASIPLLNLVDQVIFC